MNLLLIFIYLAFLILFSFLAFYIIHRAWQMRLAGDNTRKAIIIFLYALGAIVLLSIIMMLTATWRGTV